MNNNTDELFISIPDVSPPQSATSQKVKDSTTQGMAPKKNYTPLQMAQVVEAVRKDVPDFSTVCRTCATVTEFVIPIFDGEGLQNNLAEKIHKHLPIQVSETDVLPRVVCYQCASTLLAWHELVQCCAQADAALRTRLAVFAAAATGSADDPSRDKLVESECSSKEALQNSENDQQNKFKEIAEFVVQSLDPPKYESTQAALKPCGYCGAQLPDLAYRDHLVAAHSNSLFHCDECDTYVDRKDFILHMSLHAVQYAAKQDKKDIKKIKIKKEEKAEDVNNENRKCYSRKPKNQDPKVNEVQKSMARTSDPQKNEFSDHSDTEFGFGPLPNSVFEAIEDSQESQSNSKIFHALENSQDSQPDTNILEEIKDTISSQPNDIEPMEVTSTQVVNEKELPEKSDTPNQSPESKVQNPELEKGPPEPPKLTNKKSHKKSRTCPICEKSYTASSSYFYHLKHFHKGSKEHECEVCGKRFGTKACLMQHKPIHTGECRYECKECAKKFRSKASLYIHEQTHNGVKTWACSECQLSFRWRTHLVRHMKRHSAEKAHVCGTCGRGFSVRCDLLRHARTHAKGEFACEKCGVNFAQLRYLKVHMDRKHSTRVAAKNNTTIIGVKVRSIVVAAK